MTQNVAASVHQRLLNQARSDGRPFNELLQYYVLERFLYRLGQSAYADRFVLKGALLFGIWQAPLSRPTRDVDLLGRLSNDLDQIVNVMKQVCLVPVEDEDGLLFHADVITGERIVEELTTRVFGSIFLRRWAMPGFVFRWISALEIR